MEQHIKDILNSQLLRELCVVFAVSPLACWCSVGQIKHCSVPHNLQMPP